MKDMESNLKSILTKLTQIQSKDKKIVESDLRRRLFHLNEIYYVTTHSKGFVKFVKKNGRYHKKAGTLQSIQEQLSQTAPQFVQTSRSYLVNMDKVIGVDKAQRGGYLLIFDGDVSPSPLTNNFASNIADFVNLPQLDYIEPASSKLDKLKSFGLITFGLDEIQSSNIDSSSSEEVKDRFMKRHAISRYGRNKLLRLFSERSKSEIDKARVIRNIIWQVWCWLQWGIIPKFSGSIRSLWYKYVSFVLKKNPELKAKNQLTDEASVYDYFNDFVELGVFRYEDFGFKDPFESSREVGTSHPHLMLYAEKSSLLSLTRHLGKSFEMSWLMTRGQVPWITAEYFCDELKVLMPKESDKMTIFTLTDLNPGGLSIGRNLKKRLAFHGFRGVKIEPIIRLDLFDDEDIKDFRSPLISWVEYKQGNQIKRVPVNKRDKKLFKRYFEWFYGGSDWKGIQDNRLISFEDYNNEIESITISNPSQSSAKLVTLFGLDADLLDHQVIENGFREALKKYLPLASSEDENSLVLGSDLKSLREKMFRNQRGELDLLLLKKSKEILESKELSEKQKLYRMRQVLLFS